MNLRQYDQGFLGDEGEEDSFIRFEDPAYSYRAADMVLDKYGRDYGINTIEDMINRYAPPSDDNPTQSYIDFVSQQTGIGADDVIDLQNPEVRSALMSPMAMLESRTNISPQDIQSQIQSVSDVQEEPLGETRKTASVRGSRGNYAASVEGPGTRDASTLIPTFQRLMEEATIR